MEYVFNLNEKDYLISLLFWASKSNEIKNQKRNRTFRLLTVYVIIFLIFIYFQIGYPEFLYIFPPIAIAFLIHDYFYGFKNGLYKSYQKMNIEEHKKIFNNNVLLKFEETYLIKTDDNTDLKVNYQNIESIEELKDYFYLKLSNNSRIIFPKSCILNLTETKSFLINISNENSFPLIDETHWKW